MIKTNTYLVKETGNECMFLRSYLTSINIEYLSQTAEIYRIE